MDILIDKLGINGEGVGKISNKVCFVDFALPNEIVEIDIVQEKSKFLIGKIKKIIESSNARVEPKCPYYYKCGGCHLQHMNSTMQNEFKVRKIAENLYKIGHVKCNIENIVSLNEYNYRNKMVFVFVEENDRYKLAMKESKSISGVSIDYCMIANDEVNKVIKSVNNFLQNVGFKDMSLLRFLVVRAIDNQILITIVSKQKIELRDFYEYLCKNHIDQNVGVSCVVSDNGKDIMSGQYYHMHGIEIINLNSNGIKYSVDNRGFLQVNNEVKNVMYQDVLSEICENDYVVDAYSGAGLLSAIISRKCKNVVGIEINKSASNSAKFLKKDNHMENLNFVCGDVKNELNKYLTNDCVLVLDPPRAGCDKDIINLLINTNSPPKKIIYISCDTATLSRDLGMLTEKYSIQSVTPYNMFPNTKHVETLVCLQRQV